MCVQNIISQQKSMIHFVNQKYDAQSFTYNLKCYGQCSINKTVGKRCKEAFTGD